jgi:deoxyadenosine/deoxycytidine kinase
MIYFRFDFLDETMVLDLDLIVYLRTDPHVAYDRMMSRGRREEAGAPLQYLQLLHEAYEDWLINQVALQPRTLALR